jgi:SNF2 family DNA or RNA helicase
VHVFDESFLMLFSFLYDRAANKWCVTGTPMNTSVSDLRGQLDFLEIQRLPNLFAVFSRTMKSHFQKSTSRRRSVANSSDDGVGKFLFFMRNITMRHAIQMKSRIEDTCIMTLPPKVRSFFFNVLNNSY